jgi:hypothetical protein
MWPVFILIILFLGSFWSKAFAVMVMLNVGTLNQEFCTRRFAFYVLTKDETPSSGTLLSAWAPAVCSGCAKSDLHSRILITKQTEHSVTSYYFPCTHVKFSNHTWPIKFIRWSKLPTVGRNSDQKHKPFKTVLKCGTWIGHFHYGTS